MFEIEMGWIELVFLDDRFKEWAEVVKWHLGPGALSFDSEYFNKISVIDSSFTENRVDALTTLSLKAQPTSVTAKQLQVLYE